MVSLGYLVRIELVLELLKLAWYLPVGAGWAQSLSSGSLPICAIEPHDRPGNSEFPKLFEPHPMQLKSQKLRRIFSWERTRG